MHRLVAIVGLPGAGKSEVVAQFVTAGYQKIYFGGLTLESLKQAGLEINEANERMMREKLRTDHGMAAFAKLNVNKIQTSLKIGSVVIDGLYSWEEYLVLKERFPFMEVIAVWAPPLVRYQRLVNRPVRPLNETDAKSRDRSQIENSHQAGPIAMAETTIINTATIAELKKKVDDLINAKRSQI